MIKQYLKRHGIISDKGRVSMKQTTRGSNFGLRDSLYEGWIEHGLSVGESFQIGSFMYIISSLSPLSDAYEFTAIKCNSGVTISRLTKSDSESGDLVQSFTNPVTLNAYGQTVTSALRETDPGLLDTTVRIYVIPYIEVNLLDRLTHESDFQIDAIDPLWIPGLLRLQVSPDSR